MLEEWEFEALETEMRQAFKRVLLFKESIMPNPLARKKSTELAKSKKSSAPEKPAKRHPLAPLPSKDPKKKTPGVGRVGRM